MSDQPAKIAPRNGQRILERVENRAQKARNGDNSVAGWCRFERAYRQAFAEAVARLTKAYGLAETLRFICENQDEINLICSLSFINEGDLSLPDSPEVIKEAVEKAILRNGSSVQNYIVTGQGLDGECWIQLTREVGALIPAWEAAQIIAEHRDEIEAEKEHLDAQMKEQGY